MDRINVMVNGLPGSMAQNVAKFVKADQRLNLLTKALTGPDITEQQCEVEGVAIDLFTPDKSAGALEAMQAEGDDVTIVDYSHPSAVNGNAELYCRYNLPFVMGTTGGDRARLEKTVAGSSAAAVIAPNMAKQIVGFQAMMEYAAQTFPDLFKGYTLTVKESHQNGKADTSGTAKAMVIAFNQLGVSFSESEIRKERDPEVQVRQWRVPEAHLKGHGWHTYTLLSEDETVRFEFTHNVNGRDVYARGTLDAIFYLHDKVKQGARGQVFSMIDVLKG